MSTTQQPAALPAPLEWRLTIQWSEISSSTYRGKSREACIVQLRHLLNLDLIGISQDHWGVYQLTYRTPDKDEVTYPAIREGHPNYYLLEKFYARIAGDGVHWSIGTATAELGGRSRVELSLQTRDHQQIQLSGVDRDDCIAQLRACMTALSDEQVRGLWFRPRTGGMVYLSTEVREGQTMYPYAVCRYYRPAQPAQTPNFLWKQEPTTDVVIVGGAEIAPVVARFLEEIAQDGDHWMQLGPQPQRIFVWTEADKRLSVAAVGTSITKARPWAIAELRRRLAEHEDRAGDIQILMERVEVNLADLVLTPGEDEARVAGL